MSEFLKIAETVKDLGSTILIVAAAIWLLAKYLPDQKEQQGETQEVIRNNSAVINNCTKVLELVSVKDAEIKEALERVEEDTSRALRDVKYIRIQLDQMERNEHGK